ncbi:MAG TPA: glycosyl transferase family 1 [Micromonosporaceae bacterium]
MNPATPHGAGSPAGARTPSLVPRVARAVARRLPAPVRSALRKGASLSRARASVRAACGLGPKVPLLVHAGVPGADRAAASAVGGLAELPGYHLALVAPANAAGVADLVRLAGSLGVRDRLHLVPYRGGAWARFLASADLGVLGFERDAVGADLLPAAVGRYRQAGLPVVAGNARAVREYLAHHKAGQVFVPGDPRSFAGAVKRARATSPARTAVAVAAGRGAPAQTAGPAGGTAPTVGAATAVAAAVPWTPLGATPIRLGLGTANFAGQLSAFARVLCRDRPDVSAELVMAKPPASFRHPADVYLEFPTEHQLAVQLAQLQRVLGGYTHLIVDAFRPVLGRLNGDHIGADLPALHRAQIKVALLAHGSEVRRPAAHLNRHEESGFLDAPADLVTRLSEVCEQNHRIAAESGLPLFVTTPDLLDDLPGATWAPLVVDVDAFACDEPVLRRARPIVLHAPSTRWTKGTDRILALLTDLHERKVIDFRLVEGVPWDQMRTLVQQADIIIDQLVMGGYCTFACEGMAAGKAVVSYLAQSTLDTIGGTPPIVNATPKTLASALEFLLDDRDAGARLGAEAVSYVREHHDGRRTALAFAEFLR